jgi:protein-tyrosine phosphatase
MADFWEIPLPTPERLMILARPRGDDWLPIDIQLWKSMGIDTVVSLLESEEIQDLRLTQESELVQNAGMQFIEFPIADRGLPESSLGFASLIQRLSDGINAGKSVGVHCRQGIGRSAVVAAAILLSTGMDLNAALETIKQNRGSVVPETEAQRAWLANHSSTFSKAPVREIVA